MGRFDIACCRKGVDLVCHCLCCFLVCFYLLICCFLLFRCLQCFLCIYQLLEILCAYLCLLLRCQTFVSLSCCFDGCLIRGLDSFGKFSDGVYNTLCCFCIRNFLLCCFYSCLCCFQLILNILAYHCLLLRCQVVQCFDCCVHCIFIICCDIVNLRYICNNVIDTSNCNCILDCLEFLFTAGFVFI